MQSSAQAIVSLRSLALASVAIGGASWLALAATPASAQQQLAYAGIDATGSEEVATDSGDTDDTRSSRKAARARNGGRGNQGGHSARGVGSGVRTRVQPYLELTQNLLAQLKPGNDVVTYTAIAAGVEVALDGRRTQGAVSVRYERRFSEKGRYGSGDTISGLARVKHDLVPRTLSIEAGGFAGRTRLEAGGGASLGALANSDSVSQVWSVYAGPNLSTHVGQVAVGANYGVGYTQVQSPRRQLSVPGLAATDLFNHSVSQSATVSAGVRPRVIGPVGLTASAGWAQEDITNLDQRVREYRAGLQATLPISLELALVGDLGWNEVTVSSRDALRNADGSAVIGSDGRYVTDKSKPRQLAYQTRGLTWDVGVMWRPSRRTSLSAFVGRRYDSTTYYGSFSYAPNERSNLGISVYDGISGFGSSLNNAVKQLPTDFETTRNPFSGDINGCANGSSGGGCVNGALGSLSSSVFRGRGVNATYAHRIGRMQAGIGAGYARRKFIGAAGTVLAVANGTVDENYYVSAGLSGPIDRRSSFSVGAYDSWYKNGRSTLADVNSYGVTGSYSRELAERLHGTAAVGLQGISRKATPDELVLTGLVGLHYSF
ncbi:preprotein translocase subunit YajC [Novosphingobium sp. FKTRR1]|uniref:preprotein translocase subunit YajC n=1 Tax=Novosphingobium sp. FKTRR1 TaxID=2879118 RepID=UPI001CF0D062|nr:preprotein translocase subunit YajC [Novosphingobium sp. FKTRR1]